MFDTVWFHLFVRNPKATHGCRQRRYYKVGNTIGLPNGPSYGPTPYWKFKRIEWPQVCHEWHNCFCGIGFLVGVWKRATKSTYRWALSQTLTEPKAPFAPSCAGARKSSFSHFSGSCAGIGGASTGWLSPHKYACLHTYICINICIYIYIYILYTYIYAICMYKQVAHVPRLAAKIIGR